MENYKEKYEKALKVASQWHKDGIGDVKTIVECIFPELRESEDERIRKGLIKGLSAMRDIHKHQTFSDDAINIDDAIAWLEKQGKKKPADSYCQENCKGFKETGKCFADGDCKAKRDAEQNHIWSEEDYMCLPKERLAELLAERDNQPQKLVFPNQNNDYNIPCYAPNGVCVNPFRDCIDCPKMFGGGGYSTTSELQPNT